MISCVEASSVKLSRPIALAVLFVIALAASACSDESSQTQTATSHVDGDCRYKCCLLSQDVAPTPEPTLSDKPADTDGIVPFVNVAPQALMDGFEVSNYRPSAVVFDYDNDGDQDLYITSNKDNPNFLYSNRGDGTFENVSESAGVDLAYHNSSGAVACDLNNDGYKDLYVGARGIIGDGLDFRSVEGVDIASRHLRKAIGDRLFLNDGDGTFTDVTVSALGDQVNLRSASSVVCADVDGDGCWTCTSETPLTKTGSCST